MSRVSGSSTLRDALANQIRREREKQELSQEELAWRSDLHRTYISLVERSKRSLTVDSLERISTALGMSASVLLQHAESCRRQVKRNGGKTTD